MKEVTKLEELAKQEMEITFDKKTEMARISKRQKLLLIQLGDDSFRWILSQGIQKQLDEIRDSIAIIQQKQREVGGDYSGFIRGLKRDEENLIYFNNLMCK